MRLNKLGNTNIYLSAIGLGTWAIGGGGYKFGWGEQAVKDSIATIRRAVELGINWIDTAPVYGNGHAEEIISNALKGIRNKVIISTKCGVHMGRNKEDIIFNLKKESIRSEVEASLRRLQTDVIDLYMIHKPIPETDIQEGWSTLVDLIKEGKIRYAGVSSVTLDQLRQLHSLYPVAFIQNEYNMLESSIEYEILDYCSVNQIGVVVYSPLASGLLTGKFTRQGVENLPQDDWRRTLSPNFQDPYFEANLQLLEKLGIIAEKDKKTVSQLAIAWALYRPEVTSAILGARKPSQIEQTAPVGNMVLSSNIKTKIDRILNKHKELIKTLRDQPSS